MRTLQPQRDNITLLPVRPRVIKCSRFLSRAGFALWTLIGSRPDDWRVLCCLTFYELSKMFDKGCVLCRLAWLYELFVGTLLSLTNAYAGCGRYTLNCIERLTRVREAEGFSPRSPKRSEFQKRSHSTCNVCTDYVELFSSVNVNLKMFCILCLLILCIILCSTSKASGNLTFVLKQSLILSSVSVVIIIKIYVVWVLIKDCRTNYIRFISKLWLWFYWFIALF